MRSEFCSDFIYPAVKSPIVNILTILNYCKLSAFRCVLEAEETPEKSIGDLVRLIDFHKKLNRSSSTLISALINKAVVRFSLHALMEIMNQKSFPDHLYSVILDGLKPIEHRDYSSKTAFISECLVGCEAVDEALTEFMGEDTPWYIEIMPATLLVQKNRTKNGFNRLYKELLKYDRQPPWKWESGFMEIERRLLERGRFWWVRNAGGELMYQLMVPNIMMVIFKDQWMKARYDMTRIAAEFHQKFKAGDNPEKVLESLNTWKTVDSCSGKSYRWDKKKSLIYGIGIDRIDNKGKERIDGVEGADYSLYINLDRK